MIMIEGNRKRLSREKKNVTKFLVRPWTKNPFIITSHPRHFHRNSISSSSQTQNREKKTKQTSKNNESVDPQSPTTTLILQIPVNNNHSPAPLPPHHQPPTPSISHHHPHGRGPEDIPGRRVEVAVEAHAGQEGQAAPQGPPLPRAPDLRDAQAGRAPGRRLRARAALGGRRAGPRLVLRPGRRAGQGPRRQVTMPCLSIIM